MLIPLYLGGQAHRLGAEHEDVSGTVLDIRIGGRGRGREREDALRLESLPGILEGLVDGHHGQVVVVQACATQVSVIEVEAQRLYQMQFGTGNRGQSDGVTGITRNLGGIEKNLEHNPSVPRGRAGLGGRLHRTTQANGE